VVPADPACGGDGAGTARGGDTVRGSHGQRFPAERDAGDLSTHDRDRQAVHGIPLTPHDPIHEYHHHDRSDDMASCNCGREWTGLAQAHCTVCHAHFSTVGNFDAHRPSYNGCLDPGAIVNRRGEPVLKSVVNRFGVTWVGAGDRPELETDMAA
jgi:hypothetical protein